MRALVCTLSLRRQPKTVMIVVWMAALAPSAIAQAVSGQVALVPAINTVAGNGTLGYSGDGGPAISAELRYPFGVAVDSAGNLYIADTDNQRIRMVAASTGVISTVAGNGTGAGTGSGGFSGDGGPATSAELYGPFGVAVDSAGNLYIADDGSQRIRKVTATTGIISTVAGDGTAGFSGDGGPATSAELYNPNGVAVDAAGNLYIADYSNQRIRKVSASTGIISTVAGDGIGGYSGDGGPATSAELNDPSGVAVDSAGNLYIADYGNNVIRDVAASTGIISTVAGDGTAGYSGDGGPATSAELSGPTDVALDGAGNVYIADYENGRIRKVSTNAILPATAVGSTSTSQNIFVQLTAASTISRITVPKAQNNVQEFTVGTVSGCSVGGTSNPVGTVCVVPITFTPQYPGSRTGALTLYSSGSTILGTVDLTGTGTGPLGVFQPGTASVLNVGTPGGMDLSTSFGVAVDGAGDVYIADTDNYRVVEVTPSGAASVLGTGSLTLTSPFGVAVDGAGDVYIADSGNSRVVEVPPSGAVSVLSTGSLTLNTPYGMAVDGAGDIYIGDAYNNRVVEVAAGGVSSVLNVGAPGGLGLSDSSGVAVDGAGDVYISDTGNYRVVEVNQSQQSLSFASTNIGTTSSDSPQDVAVQNIGNQPLDFTALNTTTTGQTTTSFNLNGAGTTCVSSTTLAPGADCGLGVEFAPLVGGSLTGTVNITDNSLNAAAPNYATQQVNLSGTGVGAGAVGTLSPASLSFPSEAVQTTSPAQTATLSNTGTTALSITDISIGGANPGDFAETNDCGASLAKGTSCIISVTFTPVAVGTGSATLSIVDNGSTSPQILSLTGTGIAGLPPLANPTLVDPTPNAGVSLLDGSNVVSDLAPPGTNGLSGADRLATQGRAIVGVAADGVAEAVIRIPAVNVGDTFTLTVMTEPNDNGTTQASASVPEDGGLAPTGPLPNFQSTTTVTAVATQSSGPWAFAVYRAPLDFARTGNNADAGAAQKSIVIKTSDGRSTAVTIIRPPVFLIHGIWGAPSNWDNFSALVSDPQKRFDLGAADYQRSNSMGIVYNESIVFGQMKSWLSLFTFEHSVAVVQADIVAHSMGGLIARAMLLDPRFYNSNNYGQGAIHKLITLDTPHNGSDFATRLSESSVVCQSTFDFLGNQVDGAVNDLVPRSSFLTGLNHSTTGDALRAHAIVGIASSDQESRTQTRIVMVMPPLVCSNLMSGGFQSIFNGDGSDLIVSESSQQYGFGSSGVSQSAGTIHAANPVLFPFGIDALDAITSGVDVVASPTPINSPKVVNLLNTFITEPSFVSIQP